MLRKIKTSECENGNTGDEDPLGIIAFTKIWIGDHRQLSPVQVSWFFPVHRHMQMRTPARRSVPGFCSTVRVHISQETGEAFLDVVRLRPLRLRRLARLRWSKQKPIGLAELVYTSP